MIRLGVNMGAAVHRVATSLLLALHLDKGLRRYRLRNFVYERFGFAFANEAGYKKWRADRNRMASYQQSGDTGLSLPKDVPLTSIVIPFCGNHRRTLACLRSICGIGSKSPFEVIVVDDCSSEDLSPIAHAFPSVRIVRNERKQGCLRAANRGAAEAKGEYIVFLGNDTEVLPGWLDELTTALYHHPEAGMIGSQVVDVKTKRLQENPETNFFREEDFPSSASIIVMRRVFDEMNGFDPAPASGSIEDPGLALRMKKSGYRNYVMPLSRILRHGTASPNAESPERKHTRPRVLYIDVKTPMADRGSGDMDAIFFMEYFLKRGYDVVFYGEDTPGYDPKYTTILLRMGVECIYAPQRDIWTYVADEGRSFQLLFVSRIYQARRFDALLKKHCPQAAYIFNTVDVHFVREKLEADMRENPEILRRAELTKRCELQLAGSADATIVISKDEERLLSQDYGLANVWHVPQMREIHGCAKGTVRSGAVFIGSAHTPNLDGLRYFHDEILPLLPKDFRLTVVGEELRDTLGLKEEYGEVLRCPQFEFVGFVQDLGTVLDAALMTVAPLRYGAGTKGKVASSMSYGVPCVSSRFGTEGTGMVHGENILVATTPEEFASMIRALSSDRKLWQRISDGGLDFLRKNYSRSAVEDVMDKMLDTVLKHRGESKWASTPILPEAEATGWFCSSLAKPTGCGRARLISRINTESSVLL